jgi:hypothetical protein
MRRPAALVNKNGPALRVSAAAAPRATAAGERSS